jgi:hypothetical protein
MKIFSTFILILAIIASTSVNANTLLEGCKNQCWNNYQTRMAYCMNRHGGHSYEAEWCMIDEYDVYMSCMYDCETTYGPQASLNSQSRNASAKKALCAKTSSSSARG